MSMQLNRRTFVKATTAMAACSSLPIINASATTSTINTADSTMAYNCRLQDGTTMVYRLVGEVDDLKDPEQPVTVAFDGMNGAGLKFCNDQVDQCLTDNNIAMIALSKYEGSNWTTERNSQEHARHAQEVINTVIDDDRKKIVMLGFSAGALDAVAATILYQDRVSVCATMSGIADLAVADNFASLDPKVQHQLNAVRGRGIFNRSAHGPLRRRLVNSFRQRVEQKANRVIDSKFCNPQAALQEWLNSLTETDRQAVQSVPGLYNLLLQEYEIYDVSKVRDTVFRLFNRAVNLRETPTDTMYSIRHGVNDTLVPVSHSCQLATNLKALGRQVTTKYPAGGHVEAIAHIDDIVEQLLKLHNDAK